MSFISYNVTFLGFIANMQILLFTILGNTTLSLGQSFKHSLGRDSRQHIFNNGKAFVDFEQVKSF